mgnify:CR=1 FL=1|jgi:hypothetical protein
MVLDANKIAPHKAHKLLDIFKPEEIGDFFLCLPLNTIYIYGSYGIFLLQTYSHTINKLLTIEEIRKIYIKNNCLKHILGKNEGE